MRRLTKRRFFVPLKIQNPPFCAKTARNSTFAVGYNACNEESRASSCFRSVKAGEYEAEIRFAPSRVVRLFRR